MISRLDPADRQRLSRVLALLDSPVEGERHAALAAATRVLTSRGVAWRELLDVDDVPDLDEARGLLRRLLQRLDALDAWQRRFVLDVARVPRLSPRQRAKVQELAQRAGVA
jgi:hypothetical protein